MGISVKRQPQAIYFFVAPQMRVPHWRGKKNKRCIFITWYCIHLCFFAKTVCVWWKDGLKDILLEQSAHTLADMNVQCGMGINGLFMGSSVCTWRVCTLEARICLQHWWWAFGKKGVEAGGELVAQGVQTCMYLHLIFSVFHSSRWLLKAGITLQQVFFFIQACVV